MYILSNLDHVGYDETELENMEIHLVDRNYILELFNPELEKISSHLL